MLLLSLASSPLAGAELIAIESFPSGESPSVAIFQNVDGNFYGVTASGGSYSNGAIYMISTNGVFTNLYSFEGPDGAAPQAPLVRGADGALYGTASEGGFRNNGVIFKFSPPSSYTHLVAFNSTTNIPGSMPMAGLVLAGDGNFYGTTVGGGSSGDGTIFRLSGNGGIFSNIFSFSGSNGSAPYAALSLGTNRLLYGTTRYGGSAGYGSLFEIDTKGNFTNLASFNGVNGAYPNQVIQGPDGNFYGATLAGGTFNIGAIFKMNLRGTIVSLFSFNDFLGSQPVGKLLNGPDALLYGTTLAGGSNGFGTVFTISAKGVFTSVASFADFGFPPAGLIRAADGNLYGVAGSGGTDGSGVVYEIVVPPNIAITSPRSEARTTTNLITGTISGQSGSALTNLVWSITNLSSGETNSGSSPLMSNDITGIWSFSPVVSPGTNVIFVHGAGGSNIVTPIVSEEFFYIEPASFTLSTNGTGSIKGSASIPGNVPPKNGAMLNIGESYTLTAVPGKNYLFSNWTVSTNRTGNFMTSSSTLHFIMASGLGITANFVTNPFTNVAGTYSGLFYDTNNGVAEQTAGMLSPLTLGPKGAYTARLLLDGGVYTFSGSFDSSGNATKVIATKKQGPITVAMTLDWTGQINGSVSGSNWSSTLTAEAVAKTWLSGRYTMLLESASTNTTGDVPPGDGYLLLTNHLGHLVLSGALADGAAVSVAPPLGRFGDVPIFENLYGATGLIFGWLTLSNDTNDTIQATPLTWIKPSAKGFTTVLSVAASTWTNSSATDLLTDGSLVISNAVFITNSTVSIVKNKIVQGTNAPIHLLSGSVNPKTGLLTITFGNGIGKSTTTTGHGAFLQSSTNGGGYFLIKTNAGAIFLTP
ncbi:MAG TPA: choice-of-anchor tandem repeat GloVer-containing protein [Verrucomicrobiae bacterium]|nr:choice-of-anchor tandem repeat GloVer-containing protein [Verrucomicrobiae bacterium]